MFRKAAIATLAAAAPVLLPLGLVMACGASEEAAPRPPPRVRVFEVGQEALGQVRTVSGELAAADTAQLSFGVAGMVDRVNVRTGAVVEEAEVLASLDAEPLRLALEQARARVTSERAKLVESEQNHERTADLLKVRGVSQAEVEVATSALRSARASLRGAQSQLAEAERDLRRAELKAPFAGHIAKRSIEPFQEVGATEAAFVLQGDDALKVQVQLPEGLIRNVDYAQAVRVTFPTLPDLELVGLVSLIGAQASAGNTFRVEVQLPSTLADLRPGMTARVTFNFNAYLDGRTAYLIPLSALAIDAGLLMDTLEEGQGPVFVVDPASGQARLRTVRFGDLRGNQLEVFEGLAPGDQVISAGVTFVRDGMEVEIWSPEMGLAGG